MPLTDKGDKIMSAMKSQYGAEKGERVFYASRNKGTITGVDPASSRTATPKGSKSMKAPRKPFGSFAP